MEFQFANIRDFLYFLAIPILLLFYYKFHRQKKNFFKHFKGNLFSFSSYHKTKLLLELLAVTFIILSLARLQKDPERKTVSQTGRDIVFMLDLSKSMLAQDVKPNRLNRSKELILNIVAELKGDRIALVVFAGNTAVKSPLTIDYHYFTKALRKVQIQDLVKGGTQIEQALQTVLDRILYSNNNSYQDIILFTDGESRGDDALAAASAAAERGISIYTVGIGNPQGTIILDNNRNPIKFENKPVISKLDETLLKNISKITQGAYFPIHTKLANLGTFYKDFIKNKSKRNVEETQTILWKEYYQYFLITALFCLSLLTILELKRKK